MTLEAHKKHPADAIVIQRFDNGACRVSISQKSAYYSVSKKYGNKTMYANPNLAFQGMLALKERVSEVKELPIWLQCLRNQWVEVGDDDELLMYLLSIS
jgi:hypothetical protein